MGRIYTAAEQIIGRTPLLELTHLEQEFQLEAKVLAKLECFNPAGSAKDRVALAMILDAEKRGLLAPGGTAYFSTYSANFWDHRIDWFQEQADKGLLGELDMEKTRDGVIICKDGFKATTQTPEDYEAIGRASGFPYEVVEVDQSSLFLVIRKP